MSYFEACRTVTGTTTESRIVMSTLGDFPQTRVIGRKVVEFETEYCAEGSTEKEARTELARLVAGRDGTPGPITVTQKKSFWETFLSLLGEAGNIPAP